jgi:hypothetical protein
MLFVGLVVLGSAGGAGEIVDGINSACAGAWGKPMLAGSWLGESPNQSRFVDRDDQWFRDSCVLMHPRPQPTIDAALRCCFVAGGGSYNLAS